MGAHLRYFWFRVVSSLWLVPVSMIGAAVLLAFGMLYLDTVRPPSWLETAHWLLRIGPEGARQVLATIAGSKITVASLVFSMTLVTLTLASSQLGPRLITRFVSDRVNQVVLGTFVATFVYAVLVLETVSETESAPFVPQLSVTVGLILALISLLWLVYFIHHVADSIQADTVIAELGEQLSDAIEHRFPEIDLPGTTPLETPFLDRLTETPGCGGRSEEWLCPGHRRGCAAAPRERTRPRHQGRRPARRVRGRARSAAVRLAPGAAFG